MRSVSSQILPMFWIHLAGFGVTDKVVNTQTGDKLKLLPIPEDKISVPMKVPSRVNLTNGNRHWRIGTSSKAISNDSCAQNGVFVWSRSGGPHRIFSLRVSNSVLV